MNIKILPGKHPISFLYTTISIFTNTAHNKHEWLTHGKVYLKTTSLLFPLPVLPLIFTSIAHSLLSLICVSFILPVLFIPGILLGSGGFAEHRKQPILELKNGENHRLVCNLCHTLMNAFPKTPPLLSNLFMLLFSQLS